MKGFTRPARRTLSESSIVPEANQTSPPERLTHELTHSAEYWYGSPSGSKPDGELHAGTKVFVTQRHGEFARVVDERGFEVSVPEGVLTPIDG